MCGEKLSFSVVAVVAPGSPPHVRGKEIALLAGAFAVGITPACAGKSGRKKDSNHRAGDHPRMCGEKLLGILALSYG